MSEELKQTCDGLSLDEQVEMREYLSELIANSSNTRIKSPLRCSHLMEKVAKVMGRESIWSRSRDAEAVWARTFVAYQMIRECYTTTEIGKQMLKDHATVVNMRKKMQNALELPHAYKDIMIIWNEFQKQIEL